MVRANGEGKMFNNAVNQGKFYFGVHLQNTRLHTPNPLGWSETKYKYDKKDINSKNKKKKKKDINSQWVINISWNSLCPRKNCLFTNGPQSCYQRQHSTPLLKACWFCSQIAPGTNSSSAWLLPSLTCTSILISPRLNVLSCKIEFTELEGIKTNIYWAPITCQALYSRQWGYRMNKTKVCLHEVYNHEGQDEQETCNPKKGRVYQMVIRGRWGWVRRRLFDLGPLEKAHDKRDMRLWVMQILGKRVPGRKKSRAELLRQKTAYCVQATRRWT